MIHIREGKRHCGTTMQLIVLPLLISIIWSVFFLLLFPNLPPEKVIMFLLMVSLKDP